MSCYFDLCNIKDQDYWLLLIFSVWWIILRANILTIVIINFINNYLQRLCKLSQTIFQTFQITSMKIQKTYTQFLRLLIFVLLKFSPKLWWPCPIFSWKLATLTRNNSHSKSKNIKRFTESPRNCENIQE